MRRLASRTAANKLGQILGLLVIPVVVLWSIYFIKAKSEIDDLSREIAGVEFASLPPETDAATRKAFALQIGLKETKESGKSNQATHLGRIARSSGLATDGEWQSHSLADVAFFNFPAFVRLMDNALDATQTSSSVNGGSLLLAAGEADVLFRHIQESLGETSLANGAEAMGVVSQLGELSRSVLTAATYLAAPFASETDKLAVLAQLRGQYEKLQQQDGPRFQALVFNALKDRLQSRRAALWRNLLLLTLAGLVSALAGVGLSILMMRSTFIELNGVEKAKAEALEARRDAEQLNLRFSTINTDISNLNQELAYKVRELKAAQDELIKKGRMEQLGQLTATIAHEIRNPLGAIRTSAFMLQRKTTLLGADVSGQIQRINNGVNRCDAIISQLLDFSRTKEINASPALLDEWLVKVVRDEAKNLGSDINIECSLGLEGLQVPFDPARLQRAVINLLNNACEALGQMQEATLAAGHRHNISISTLQRGEMACIRISDNGPGIPADIINRIREPLFTTKSFGTGLGIPAVEQIVRQHGGLLDIASDAGKGATFTINLPLPLQKREDHAA